MLPELNYDDAEIDPLLVAITMDGMKYPGLSLREREVARERHALAGNMRSPWDVPAYETERPYRAPLVMRFV